MNRQAIKLLLIALVFNSAILNAQSRREIKDKFFEAESWMLFEEYQDALPLYLELLELYPQNYNYRYRIGVCYLNIPGQKEKALPYLKEAVRHIDLKYREGKFREKNAPYDALFYLGAAYRITNQLDSAIETYRSFYEGMDHKTYDSTIVKLQIQACINAKKLMKTPLYLKQENMGEYINDTRSDVNPVVSADEKTMVFTRELAFYEGIFYSKKVDGLWSPPIQIQAELLIDDGYSTSLSPDGNELYIYRDDGYDGNIYVSNYENGRWSPAEKLNDNINTKYWESHACISGDGKRLFFTSNRKGGYGGLDIYVSEKDSVGEWGPANNLGPVINTPFNEETPFLSTNDDVLFFSSRGHFNMGGHDIFYSTKADSNSWSAPVNMGYPVNSTDDDLFFSPVGDGYLAYMAKFDSDGYGMEDIFRVEIFSDEHPRKFFVRGIVKLKDLLNQYNDSVRVSALDRSNMDTLVAVYSDPHTGEYEFEIPQGEYKLVYESEGSKTVEKNIEFELTQPGDSIMLPYDELEKADYIADIRIPGLKDSVTYESDDTARIKLLTEPESVLTAEHWQGDSLLKTEEFFILDSVFIYQPETFTGSNNIRFTLKDRFNNISTIDYNFLVSEPEIEEPVVEETVVAEPDPEEELLAQQKTIDSLETIQNREKESIDRMEKVISEVSHARENEQMKEVIQKINLKQIKKASEWLESLYSVAIEDGTEKELLTKLIAAMSAEMDDSAEDYLARLKEFAGPELREALEKIDPDKFKDDDPEELIDFLLSNADRMGYSKNDVFEAFSKIINASDKTAEEIVDYITAEKESKPWILWILLGGATIAIIILVSRRKKNKND
ncbi:MAG: hypothetical protein R6V34_04180 [Bacteroidales bacterium]